MDYLRSRDNKIVKYPTTSIGLFKIEESEALVCGMEPMLVNLSFQKGIFRFNYGQNFWV